MKQVVPIMDHIFAKRMIKFKRQKTMSQQQSLNILKPLDEQQGDVVNAVLQCIDHLFNNMNTITRTNTNTNNNGNNNSNSSSSSAFTSSASSSSSALLSLPSTSSSNNNSSSSSSSSSSLISSHPRTANTSDVDRKLLIKMIRRSGLLTSLQRSVMFVSEISNHISCLPDTIIVIIRQYSLPYGMLCTHYTLLIHSD